MDELKNIKLNEEFEKENEQHNRETMNEINKILNNKNIYN